jgi:glycosyltransferase involved in cell wall biosynthesis
MIIGMGVPTLGFQGGIERHAHDLARSLGARGHQVVLLHGAARGRDQAAYASAFCDVRAMADAGAGRGLDVAYAHKVLDLDEVASLAGVPLAVAAHDHDLTCVRSHRYTPRDRTPCHRAPGVGCITSGCAVIRDRRPENPLPIALRSPFALVRRLRAIAANAPVVACSGYVAAGLLAAGVSAERVHVVHPIPPEDDAPLVPRPTALRLLAAGQLVRGKGFDIAVEAMRFLPATVTLDIAGDGPDREALEARAREVAPGRVRILGYVPPEAMNALYDGARAVLVPSRWPEPFGMVGVEAMRRGRPVVGSAHGGVPEWLRDGVAGRLFAPGRADELADAARAVLVDDAAGARAHAYVRARFSHATTVDSVERLLATLRNQAALPWRSASARATGDASPLGTVLAGQLTEA